MFVDVTTWDFGFKVWGLGFGVWGLGFGVQVNVACFHPKVGGGLAYGTKVTPFLAFHMRGRVCVCVCVCVCVGIHCDCGRGWRMDDWCRMCARGSGI